VRPLWTSPLSAQGDVSIVCTSVRAPGSSPNGRIATAGGRRPFDGVEGRCAQVVEVLDLLRVLFRRRPELDADGEPGDAGLREARAGGMNASFRPLGRRTGSARRLAAAFFSAEGRGTQGATPVSPRPCTACLGDTPPAPTGAAGCASKPPRAAAPPEVQEVCRLSSAS
jgi:hypothetical protein